MSKPAIPSRSFLTRIGQATDRVLGTLPAQASPGTVQNQRGVWYWAKLIANLDAPTDGMASPTTAGFDIWLPNDSSTPPVTLIRTTDTAQQGLVVVNRWTGLAATNGTILQVEFAWGEWTIKGIDC